MCSHGLSDEGLCIHELNPQLSVRSMIFALFVLERGWFLDWRRSHIAWFSCHMMMWRRQVLWLGRSWHRFFTFMAKIHFQNPWISSSEWMKMRCSLCNFYQFLLEFFEFRWHSLTTPMHQCMKVSDWWEWSARSWYFMITRPISWLLRCITWFLWSPIGYQL